jgi:hypothetical protein
VNPAIEATLQQLMERAPRVDLSARDRIVIMSDLHLGDGGSRDDFRHNGGLVQAILRDHYLPGGYTLVLNGDIEELQRFNLPDIRGQWSAVLSLFKEFEKRSALYKIVGNHDQALWLLGRAARFPLLEAVRFTYKEESLLVFHGHQATIFFERFNGLSGFFLRYAANTLRIPNTPVAYESTRKYRTEHRVYEFASGRKLLAIIGHTHRPLFESMSKIDTVRFQIEKLCREYTGVGSRGRAEIEGIIADYRRELGRLWERDREDGLRSSLYNEQICIPCLFNSGCGIGKRGMTAIEIAGGAISLVHWFDRARDERHMVEDGRKAVRLAGTGFYRSVIKQEKLEYVFSRVRLLA